jgi:hypothetical protein
MVNYERIAAEAAELAHQFWREMEAEFTRQAAQRWADLPDRTGILCNRTYAMSHDLSRAADRSCCGACTTQPLSVFDHTIL